MPFDSCLALADATGVGDAYPVRLGEAQILRWAMENGSSTAPFLLGCLLYDKRQYPEATALFDEAIHLEPENYMAYRSLAVAYFSHLDRKEEALLLMKKARAMHPSQQMLYESVILLDLMDAAPSEKIALLEPYAPAFRRDDLFVELAKAYNQNRQPQKALELLMSHVFIACEGGEHAIADQYMYAYFQMGMAKLRGGAYADALSTFTEALGLEQKAWNIMSNAKRKWTKALTQTDNGFFSTTPFFISFVQQPEILHRAYYLYLLAFVALYENKTAESVQMFRESNRLNSDHLFCSYYAGICNQKRSGFLLGSRTVFIQFAL